MLLFDPAGPAPIHSRAGLRALTTDQTNGYEVGTTVERTTGLIPKWGAGFMIKGNSAEQGLASPASYGHQGATGCVGWADPTYGVTIAFVSNSHVRKGYREWIERLEEAVNVALAAAT